MISKRRIIYICANDGTDTRVVKELKTLSKKSEIIFIGCNKNSEKSFIGSYVKRKFIFTSSHRNPVTYLLFNLAIVFLRLRYRCTSIHVVDEQTFLFVWLSCLWKPVTLDIFDSIFLKYNLPNDKGIILKRLLYGLSENIIVTDQKRKTLLPVEFHHKSVILPNVPFRVRHSDERLRLCNGNVVRFGCFGTLTEDRGINFLSQIAKLSPKIEITCAGWIPRAETRRKIEDSISFNYLGVLQQDDVFKAMQRTDFLCMIYPSNNLNNQYASPNKLYDAIHLGIPVICNDDMEVAKYVDQHKLGITLSRKEIDYPDQSVIDKIMDFVPLADSIYEELKGFYCWENYQEVLINCHRLNVR